MSGFAFKIEGLTETLSKFNSLPDEVKQAVDDELTATAEAIASDARIFAPVDLGALHQTKNILVTRNEPLLKQVSSLAEYSAYVEFGTGTKVSITSAVPGLAEYAIQFKGAGKTGKHPVKIKGKWYMVPYQVNIRAQPFFFPAYAAQTAGLVQRLKAIIEETAKK